jgi:hypothetical protein
LEEAEFQCVEVSEAFIGWKGARPKPRATAKSDEVDTSLAAELQRADDADAIVSAAAADAELADALAAGKQLAADVKSERATLKFIDHAADGEQCDCGCAHA